MTDEYELLKIAERVGIAADQVIRWNYIESPHFRSKNPGRPKGKIKRPAGCLSIGDVRKKYDLTTEQIRRLREAGMPSVTLGTLVAIRESDLKAWLVKHPI